MKVQLEFDFEAGNVIEFVYPRHNFFGVVGKMIKRRLQVTSVRDLKREPINDVTVDIQPLLRRGRILVTGVDLDCQEERSFYATSMRDVREAS